MKGEHIKGVWGYGTDLQNIKEQLEKPLKREWDEYSLKDLEHLPMAFMKSKFHKTVDGVRFITIQGAAGEEDIPQEMLKVMTDPYDNATRDFFTECILTDPIMSPATDRRVDSIYEDGFHLELIDATAKEADNTTMTEGEKEQDIKEKGGAFDMVLQKLQTWTEDIDLLSNMKDASGVSFAQGRACSLITPPLQELPPMTLPFTVEIIATEDLREPIVDIGLTKKIVAINTDLLDKPVLRTDEIVYITRGKRGFRKDAKAYGTSPLEPILQISKSLKRIYNYDIPEAIISAYLTKVLFTIEDQGDPTTQNTRIQAFIADFIATGKYAFAMSTEVKKIDHISPKVDTQMIDTLENKMADVELSVVGVPKSMMNREHGLNRDIATIEAIQFIRFVRKPDEALLAQGYETQLLNPLFAIMLRKPLSEIPKRVKIVRNKPDGADLDTIFVADNLTETKEGEIDSEKIVQNDATSTFGASGKYTITSESGNRYNVTSGNR